jgi:hypothetical protein
VTRDVKEALLGKLVMVLSGTTPEKLATIYHFATGEPLGSAECRMENEECRKGVPSSTAGAKGGRDYSFRWTGRDWKVVFDGGEPFYLPDTLGAPYLDYLLHRPNQPISAFDLEVAVSPDKGEARAPNSIQPESDARALAEYREQLGRLQERRKELEAAGDADAREHLDNEVTALESALTGSDRVADTGKRAFDNVRKAVGAVRKHLRQGGPEERAFEEHLRSHLSLGHECLYSAPEGPVWV